MKPTANLAKSTLL